MRLEDLPGASTSRLSNNFQPSASTSSQPIESQPDTSTQPSLSALTALSPLPVREGEQDGSQTPAADSVISSEPNEADGVVVGKKRKYPDDFDESDQWPGQNADKKGKQKEK